MARAQRLQRALAVLREEQAAASLSSDTATARAPEATKVETTDVPASVPEQRTTPVDAAAVPSNEPPAAASPSHEAAGAAQPVAVGELAERAADPAAAEAAE